MIRLLIFIALVFIVAVGSAWIADKPGIITLDWQGYQIETGVMTAAVALLGVLAVGIILWNVALYVLRTPDHVGRFFRRRRKDRGYDAMSKGLLALGVGDAAGAGRHGAEAAKLLPGEPATQLLLAQSAQLDGRHEEARSRFEAMLDDPALRPVGLHGLYIEAERLNEPVAARHYAEEAARLMPGLDWAGRAVLGYQAVSGDWADAIKTLEKNYAAKLVDKKTFRRHKAVLLTAQALELEDRDPDAARQKASEAHGLAPALVPAAVLAARLATRRGDIRKAMKVVETTWKLTPHPELADAYAHARTGDSAQDRLKRVKSLAALRAHNAEGALALAQAAIEANEWELARSQMKAALRLEPTQRVFLMMADLEERQHGDRGRVREWLARAVRAPSDPAWVADGVVSETWSPVSPVDGRLDAFVWTTPPATLDHHDDPLEALDETLLEALPAAPAHLEAVPLERKPAPDAAPAATATAETGVVNPAAAGAPASASPPGGAAASAAEAHPVGDATPSEDASAPGEREAAVTGRTSDPAKAAGAPAPSAETAPEARPTDATGKTEAAAEKSAEAKGDAPKEEAKPDAKPDVKTGGKGKDDLSRPIEFPLKHMPDDPGPDDDPDAERAKKPGFRFFN
ncbi:heme biosynthesis protein HemY [Stappia sp. ES.058]|uniref:heme biosynthesis protein HemY n=1 Tax=Stappia sp. ES.058 TaxID=1881061 RepID=UPI00087CB4E9|nr:heme biosynthesis HemY N-terminal domain-containing protein [Stappia sp. ES.058]SDU41194.1 HemY protein [Stappia sp. ES.058]